MKILVTPGPDGRISNGYAINGQPVPPGAVLVDVPDDLNLGSYEVLFLRDGKAVLGFDYRGSGPWYDQMAATEDRLVAHHITQINIVPPNDLGHPVTAGWASRAMSPRPETAAEIVARVQAEADARAAAEAARKASRVLTPLQIRRAANQLGLRDEIEALMANPQTPMDLKDYWIAALEFQRSHPAWPQVLALMGKTETDLDALYDLGETL